MVLALLSLWLYGCAHYRVDAPPWPPLARKTPIVVVPLANATTTPYAGKRAQAIVAASLQHAGFQVLLPPPSQALPPPVGRPLSITQEMLSWARKHGARYLMGGTVTEWRYKVGLEGMPAVALTLVLYELTENSPKRIWSANLSGIGHGRQNLGLIAQKLILQVLP